MYQVTLRGTYEQIGAQEGAPLGRAGVRFPAPHPDILRFAHACEEVVGRYAPELLVETHAFAEASGIDYETVMSMVLAAPFDPAEIPPAGACTVVAVMPERAAGGHTIVGRNYDFFYDISKDVAVRARIYPAERGAYASIGTADIFVGRADGLSEAGLFLGIASCFLPGIQPGLIFWLAGRHVLDRCATVDEALAFLTTVPYAGSWNYLVADRFGKAAVVETSAHGAEVRYPEDGLLVMTNHAVCPPWVGKETFVPPDSHPRYDRLCALLGGRHDVTVEEVQHALADHTGLVCCHGKHFPDRKFGTLWSVVGRPGDRVLYAADGHPCRAKFRPRTF